MDAIKRMLFFLAERDSGCELECFGWCKRLQVSRGVQIPDDDVAMTFIHTIAMSKKTWNSSSQAGKDYRDKSLEQFLLDPASGHDARNAKRLQVFKATPGMQEVEIAPAEWEKMDKVLAPMIQTAIVRGRRLIWPVGKLGH
jgi:hypothetical protein